MRPVMQLRSGASNGTALTREQQAQRLLVRRRFQKYRRVTTGVALPMVLLLGLWAHLTGRMDQAVHSLDETGRTALIHAGITVESIKVKGRNRTDRNDLYSALDVARGQSLLHLDLAHMRARVEALDWVKTARLYRVFPNRLHLDIEEREPFAIWQYEGRLHVIDRDGAVIVPAAPEEFSGLFLVVGQGASDDVLDLDAMLSIEPALAHRVAAAVRVADRRWNIRFKNGIEARLPEEDAGNAWRQLARLDRQHSLLDREIVYVDLRLADRLIVRRRAVAFRIRGDGKEI